MINAKTKTISKPVIFAVAAVFCSLGVFAQVNPDSSNNSFMPQKDRDKQEDRIMEKKENKEQNLERRTIQMCNARKNTIQNRINMYTNTERFHRYRFRQLYQRLEKFIMRVEEMGVVVDLTNIKSYMPILDEKITAIETAHEELIVLLREMAESACDEDKQKFMAMWTEAKPLLEQIRTASTDAREYLQNTIKPELQKIRTALLPMTGDGEPEKETEGMPGEPVEN